MLGDFLFYVELFCNFVEKGIMDTSLEETEVVVNTGGSLFITLIESKLLNTWYHKEFDTLFCLTARGFRVVKGSKLELFARGLGDNHK